MIETQSLQALCAHINHFSASTEWRWKALPIVTWEFGTVREYHNARAELRMAIARDMSLTGSDSPIRAVNSACEEFDCYGVTFRLVCKEMTMTVRGPIGVVELMKRASE